MVDTSDDTNFYILIDADPASFITSVLAKIDSTHTEIDDDSSEWREEEGTKAKVPLHFCKFKELVFPQDLLDGDQFNIYVYKGYVGFAIIAERNHHVRRTHDRIISADKCSYETRRVHPA